MRQLEPRAHIPIRCGPNARARFVRLPNLCELMKDGERMDL